MIVVIADDFTGAAELGGIGIRYGLNCEIHTEVPESSKADLLIIAKNTRSLPVGEALDEIEKIVEKLSFFPVDWIYKKTDSVLRGHVVDEIEAIRKIKGQEKVLLVPANPSLGRTISGGEYFINERPLHETDLRYDLPNDRHTSEVITLLKANKQKHIYSLHPDQFTTDYTFVIGDATNDSDLQEWAERGIEDHRFLAGAADFFNAVLQVKGYEYQNPKVPSTSIPGRSLFIFGSASSYSKNILSRARKEGWKICDIPPQLFKSDAKTDDLIDEWANHIVTAFKHHRQVIASINKPLIKDARLSLKLRYYMTALVKRILNQGHTFDELWIEGGATASTIAEGLHFTKFLPLQEFVSGVVRMKVEGQAAFHITIKPGSYSWPDEIWNLKENL